MTNAKRRASMPHGVSDLRFGADDPAAGRTKDGPSAADPANNPTDADATAPDATAPPADDFDDDGGPDVPAWLASTLNYCSRCGAPLRHGPVDGEDRDRLACDACGFIAYVNPRLVVTCLPVTDAGEVMLLRRGIEPARGLWAQPGGFMEIDETVREGVIRETQEEMGLLVEPGDIIGLYTRTEAAVVVIAFEARIIGGAPTLTKEALEIAAFAPDAIPWDGIAFRTSEWALRDWVRRVRPDLPLPKGSAPTV